MDKIQCGAIKLLGRVGECQPPRVVMPLTVEPSKPRLCHDELYINLWIKDLPFRLETLKDIHRLVDKNALLITWDEKSGYSHIKIDDERNILVFSLEDFSWCIQHYHLVGKLQPLFTNP